MLTITRTPDDAFDQVAIVVGDYEIVDPFVSECGRFEADPDLTYGIDPKLAELLNALNCYLRGDPLVSDQDDGDAEQTAYAKHEYGACPQCGSDQLEGNDVSVDGNTAAQEMVCLYCSAGWYDDYSLSGFTLIEHGRFGQEGVELLEARYIDQVLNDDNGPEQFMGIEIQGVRDVPKSMQVDAETRTPETTKVVDSFDPEFFSVYLRHRDGRALCVGDHATIKRARTYAKELSEQYGWPVTS